MDAKREIPDGDPIPMSEFTLGERYGSEDMYRDMGIVPGSRVAFEKDGVLYTDTVQSVTYSSAEYVPRPKRTLWQRIVWRVTPMRFRKPIPRPPSKPATVTIQTGRVSDDVKAAYERNIATIRQAGEFIDGLISGTPPDKS